MERYRRSMLQQLSASALAATGLATIVSPTHPQAFPARPVRLVVPYPASGTVDCLARVIAEPLSKQWQQPVIVDTKAGASGLIGTDVVTKAEPNGYTALLTITTPVQTPNLYAMAPFDVLCDFAPASEMGTTELVFVVNRSVAATKLADFIALGKAGPGKFSYGSFGIGSSGHLLMESFKNQTQLDLAHIAYKREAPALTDLLRRHVSRAIFSVMGARPHIASGNLRALARDRPPSSRAASRCADLRGGRCAGRGRIGLVRIAVPAATPRAVVERYSTDVIDILALPAVAQRAREMGVTLKGTTPAACARTKRRDSARWTQIIRDNNIHLE